jgi:hypothetical protein
MFSHMEKVVITKTQTYVSLYPYKQSLQIQIVRQINLDYINI